MTGGGSGGHITPLLSLAHELKKSSAGCEVIYIGHKGDQFDNLQLSTRDFDFTAFINSGKFRRYYGEGLLSHLNLKTLALNARDLFRVIAGISASLRILRKVKPDVVFSKGGFVAVPVGVAARLLKIPIITHDSDAIPGLANKIVGRWAKVKTSGMKSEDSNKTYVGIPINPAIRFVAPKLQAEYKKELGLPIKSRLLLIGGAGNGAQSINELVVKIAPTLLRSDLGLRIVHLAGRAHAKATQDNYENNLEQPELERVQVMGFSNDFYKYCSAADLIISRAGATSIAEFAVEGKACVIIPSPFLAGGHQLKNADILKSHDAAVIFDNNASADELLGVVGELLNDSDRRAQLAKNLHGQAVEDAAAKLAKIILSTAKDS